jgi:cysteine desulfurase
VGAGLKLKDRGRHIVANRTEHLAVLNPLEFLEKEFGFYVTYVDSDRTGRISTETIQKALQPDTVLITLMAANNETGTLQPVQEVARLAREKNIFFHCDAVQALGKIPVSVQEWPVDSLSFSGHKISAPKGVGVLYLRKGVRIRPFLTGGHQERNVRPGTENVAGIAAFGKACELIEKNLEESRKRLLEMREKLEEMLLVIPGAYLNGHPTERLPNTLNVSFDNVQGEGLLIRLDIKGIAVSSGSACTSGSIEPSHVLQSMGLEESRARSAVRFSLGWDSKKKDMEYVGKTVQEIVRELRLKK